MITSLDEHGIAAGERPIDDASGAGPVSSVAFTQRGSGTHPLDLLAPGELVAERFVVEYLAAVGGMSVVYRATDLTCDAPVALKLLARRDRGRDARFEAEAATLAALSHPSIVRYVARGVTRQRARFLAMEWLSGEDLATRLARSGLRATETLALMRHLCAALDAAHARGVLHRDIKPSNVFLVDGSVDSVKLLDFGVARRDNATGTVTKAGALIGTVGYMAPEQARGAVELDARTDVFALGCVLFECLTGKPAFSGSHDLAVLAKVLCEEPPRVSLLRPDLGTAFDALMGEVLAKDRTRRPPSAGAMLQRCEQAQASVATLSNASAPVPSRAFEAEQRIQSVILGQPSRPDAPRDADDAGLDELARDFGAEVIAMRGGELMLVLTAVGHATATDQAVRAARCSLRLSRQRPDLALGVATGAVDTSAHVPVGVAIDRAAALLGDAGSLKIDALTASLLGSRFDTRATPHGLVLSRERDDSDEADVLMGKSTPFVGRAKEMAILDATLRECIGDEVARAVLVTGPAGAGKSRLGREFLDRVRREKCARVLLARGDPTTAGSALSVIQHLIRSAASLRTGAPAEAQQEQLSTYLHGLAGREERDQLVDFLSEILQVGESQPLRPLHRAARGDPEVMREQKRRAFERFMSAEVARGPLVLFLEDLHWGDLPSITYIQDLLRSLAGSPIFVLATARPELHAQFPRLCACHDIEELSLRGLTKKAAERLARALLPSDTLPSVIDKVVGLSGGNAFYLEELVRRVAEGSGAELPETVVAMAQSRLERLPPEARGVLRAASVFGESAWVSGVEVLLPPSFETRAMLDWLTDQEILKPRGDTRFPGEREYAFRHALLREAAYTMLTESDRRTSHLRAAEWLETRGERDARVLADHFECGGAVARAIPWIAKASMAALDGGDFESAIALSHRGTSLGAYGDQRGMLLLVRAYASVWKSNLELPGEALSLLPRASAPWWLALSLHVFGSTMLGKSELAEPYLHLALTTSPDVELTGPYGQAIQVLAAGSSLVGRASIGWALVSHFEHATERKQALLDPAFLAWFNLTKCILASNSLTGGRWALGDALRSGRASVAAMRVLGSASGEAAALFHLANVCWLLGGYEQSVALLGRSLELAKQTGNLLVEQHCTFLLAIASMRSGAQATATLSALEGSTNLHLSHGAAAVLADSLCREGRVADALARAEALARGPSLLYRRMAAATCARARLALHQPAAALEATERALHDGEASAFPQLTVDLLGSRARALLDLGARDDAARTIDEALRFRAAAASEIDDQELCRSFTSHGRANRLLDALARGDHDPSHAPP